MFPTDTAGHAHPCIWMSAGLLSYRLCDHDFDCESCPLDAALRGRAAHPRGHVALLSPGELDYLFPDDRLYSPGHSWLQSLSTTDGPRYRFGVDAFAAAMLGRCERVSCRAAADSQAPGGVFCEIDLGLGVLFVAIPIAATLVTKNERLDDDPNQLVTSPYGDGWIADLQALDPAQLDKLCPADAARDRTRVDLRHFRRQVALQLFADTEDIGECLADGGELADLRQMLVGHAYMKLVRDLIH